MLRGRTRLALLHGAPKGALVILAAAGLGLLLAFVTSAVGLGDGLGEGGGELLGVLLPLLGLLAVLALVGPFAGVKLARTCRTALRSLRRSPGGGRVAAAVSLETEQAILALANARAAPLTIAEVALHCRLSILESKRALASFVDMGVAHALVTDHGDLAYVISGLRPNPTTRSAPAPRRRGRRSGALRGT